MSLALQQVVANHPFARGLAPSHLQILTDCAMLTRFDSGQTLFHEGDIANRFYLIQSGRVALETKNESGGLITIQTVGAGDVVGWSWMFPPYYWHFTASALESTEAIFFYGTMLRETCNEDREFGYQLMKRVTGVLLQRLQSTIKESFSLLPPDR